jgi:hypothetical protein
VIGCQFIKLAKSKTSGENILWPYIHFGFNQNFGRFPSVADILTGGDSFLSVDLFLFLSPSSDSFKTYYVHNGAIYTQKKCLLYKIYYFDFPCFIKNVWHTIKVKDKTRISGDKFNFLFSLAIKISLESKIHI